MPDGGRWRLGELDSCLITSANCPNLDDRNRDLCDHINIEMDQVAISNQWACYISHNLKNWAITSDLDDRWLMLIWTLETLQKSHGAWILILVTPLRCISYILTMYTLNDTLLFCQTMLINGLSWIISYWTPLVLSARLEIFLARK